ncbi:MAG: ABC transporter permease [Thermodesulfovibrionales bacterium]|nr:ABC transporter permease [Thermodesulfovibrionales bacterium]
MDRFIHILSQSIRAIRAFKLRTLFCLLSVGLGVSSITIIVAATEGAYEKALEIVAAFGPDSLLVFGGSEEIRALGQRQRTITLEDVEAIRREFSTAYLVVPMTAVREVNVSYKNKRHQTLVIGSTSQYSRVWTWPVIQGSDFTEEDVRGMKNVCLMGLHVVRQLFGDEDPVGKYIFVRKIPVQVVGVLSERGTSPGGDILDDRIIMPITTVMRKLQNETRFISAFRIRFEDRENLNFYINELRHLLRQRHGLKEGEPDDFRIVSPKEITRFLVALTGTLVAFLGVTGLISLIVAGFVLANLFLLSVRERISEIGIRRAVGASKRDIFLQFLGEAVILTTSGGLVGFILAVAGSKVLTLIFEFPMKFSWKAFTIGIVLSWLVGVIFGIQPARKAAELHPVEAIRG